MKRFKTNKFCRLSYPFKCLSSMIFRVRGCVQEWKTDGYFSHDRLALMSTKSLLFLNTADSTIGDVFVWLNSIGINIKKRLEPSLIILNLK